MRHPHRCDLFCCQSEQLRPLHQFRANTIALFDTRDMQRRDGNATTKLNILRDDESDVKEDRVARLLRRTEPFSVRNDGLIDYADLRMSSSPEPLRETH